MRTRKRYGQHFLEAAWADKLVAAISPEPADRFLEIGPGPGALTLRLAPLVARLTAVEVDPGMIAALRPHLPGNVELIQQDFLEFDLETLRREMPIRVAGNLPYNVSSPILFRLIDTHRRTGGIVDATLMVQREVADRIQAGPGTRQFGVLSILVQLHADASLVLALPPGAFRPPPKVRSAVVRLRFRAPAVILTNEMLFEAMVRSMFTQRRKTLLNALRPFAATRVAAALNREDPSETGSGTKSDALSRSVAEEALRRAGIDPRRRPETLQLTELARLAEFFVSATD